MTIKVEPNSEPQFGGCLCFVCLQSSYLIMKTWKGVTSLPAYDAAVFKQNKYKLKTAFNSKGVRLLEQMLKYEPCT